MKKRIIACIVLTIMCSFAYGQILQLTDQESGAPVPYASIIIKTEEVAIVSDAMGKFSLAGIAMPVEIMISHLSYERLSMRITSQTSQVIALTPKSRFLDDIVVSPKDERKVLQAAFSQLYTSFENGIIAKALVNQWSEEGDELRSLYQADGYLLLGGMSENFKPDNLFPYYQAGYLPTTHRISYQDTLPEVHRQQKGYYRIITSTLVANALYNYCYIVRFLWQEAKKADKYFPDMTTVENGFMYQLKDLKKLEIYQQGIAGVSLLVNPDDSSILQLTIEFKENAYREFHRLMVGFSNDAQHIHPSYMNYTVKKNNTKLTLNIRPYYIGLKGFNLEMGNEKYKNSRELDKFYAAINSSSSLPSYLSFEALENQQKKVFDDELRLIAKSTGKTIHTNWLTGPYTTVVLGPERAANIKQDVKSSDLAKQRDLFINKLIEVLNKKL